MSIVLGPNQYGKAENRVVRIVRDTDRHEIRDLNVSTSLRGGTASTHPRQGLPRGRVHQPGRDRRPDPGHLPRLRWRYASTDVDWNTTHAAVR